MAAMIDDFLDAYMREFDFYQEASRLCAQEFEKMLTANGIRAIVTFRAKRHTRLKDKLTKRNAKKPYKTTDAIRSDIVDFAGVRAALYFPGDRDKVAKLAHEAFEVIAVKSFPERTRPRSKKRFTGYHATHLRVRLRIEELGEPQRRFASTPVEIQIASVLMHAWSEVEHDLVYKPLSGELSIDENDILDELNGLMLAGEIALERLQRAVELRVRSGGSKFTNHYELAAFLYNETKPFWNNGTEPSMGVVDDLLRLLRKAHLDTPDAVKPFVDALDVDAEGRPIADQISDRVLSQRPDLYSAFFKSQNALVMSANPKTSQPSSLAQPLSWEYLKRWILLEAFNSKLTDPRSDVVQSLSRKVLPPLTALRLAALTGLDRAELAQVDYLRMLRNRVVHGKKVSSVGLRPAIAELDRVLALIRNTADTQVRDAMTEAEGESREFSSDEFFASDREL